VRFLNVLSEDGIVENVGEPLDFEVPFWTGEHPADTGGWPNAEPYPLPFHPLDLGEHALRALFGFANQTAPQPGDINTFAVRLHGFRSLGRLVAHHVDNLPVGVADEEPPHAPGFVT